MVGVFPEGTWPMVTLPPKEVGEFHRGFAHLGLWSTLFGNFTNCDRPSADLSVRFPNRSKYSWFTSGTAKFFEPSGLLFN